jgi:hypothetical protein
MLDLDFKFYNKDWYFSKPHVYKLSFLRYLSPTVDYLSSVTLYEKIPTEDVGCFDGAYTLFHMLLKQSKPEADFCKINYYERNDLKRLREKIKSFACDAKQKELYVDFSILTTATICHATMLHLKKEKDGVSIFYKNSFGNCLKADFNESFPEVVNALKKIFGKVKIVSDKTQQQPLSSKSCVVINYYNMIDHAFGCDYRIPPVGISEDADHVAKFRLQLSKDWDRFREHYFEAMKATEIEAIRKMPKLVQFRNKLNEDNISVVSENNIKKLMPLFKLQEKIFIEKLDTLPLKKLLAEQINSPKHTRKKNIAYQNQSFDSRKIWIAGMILAAVCGLCLPVSYAIFVFVAASCLSGMHYLYTAKQTPQEAASNKITKPKAKQNESLVENRSLFFTQHKLAVNDSKQDKVQNIFPKKKRCR